MRISDWSSERLLFRSGQYSWLADQLLFKTGNSDDQVKVTQGENGQLRFAVNGEEYDVALARGQQLTVRTGDGNDNIEIDPSEKVNFIIEPGDGHDTIQGGGGTDPIAGATANAALANAEPSDEPSDANARVLTC